MEQNTNLWALYLRLPRHFRVLLYGTVAIALATVAIILLKPAETEDWNQYLSNQGAFTVEVPAPSMQVNQDDYSFFDRSVRRFTHEASVENGVFQVIHFDMPQGAITPAEQPNVFNFLAANFLLPVNGIIQTTSETSVRGYPGIRVTARGTLHDESVAAEAIVVMVSNRLYTVGWYGPDKRAGRRDRDRFLASFKFTF